MSAAVLVAAPMVVGVAAPAGARAAAPRFTVIRNGAAAVPNTDIKGKGAGLKFAPAKVNASWSGPPPVKKCTKKHVILTITNSSKSAAVVTQNGTVFVTIPAGEIDGICGWGSGKQTITLGLQGSTHTLAIKFS